MRALELNQLRYFLAVAKHENFSRAASELYIAQPSLSKSMAALEAELGLPLFERNGKRIRLSEAGRILQEKLYPVIGIIDSLKRDLHMQAGLSKSTIVLNVLAASYFIPDILMKFRTSYPLVDFHLMQSERDVKSDLCICATLPDTVLENSILVLSEEIKLAVPVDSPLALRNSVGLRELKEQSFIALTKTKALRTITDHFFELAGYEPRVEFVSDSPNMTRDLVRAGLGVAMWPEITWGKIPADRVKLIRIENPTCRRNLFVTQPKGMAIDGALKVFLDFIEDYFLKLIHASASA